MIGVGRGWGETKDESLCLSERDTDINFFSKARKYFKIYRKLETKKI